MNHQIAVIGLGYVGLPLARLLATRYPVVGFDTDGGRVKELMSGMDQTGEISAAVLQGVLVTYNPYLAVQAPAGTKGLYCTTEETQIEGANTYIITVPTPIDRSNRPDLRSLYRASETVGRVLKEGDLVIYESTVYPGVTEEECVPILERVSGLKFNADFFCGYSPERVNPGDRKNTIDKIVKVTSGSTPEAGDVVDRLYRSVITAGTHPAPSIKVAEASKVVENAQRDVNIAFVNELAKIFSLMEIDTKEVLAAAGTKWNFLPFKPGLVGGHCIGVDPFYLVEKAHSVGHYSELILAARRVNDSMGLFVGSQVVKLMIRKGIRVKGAEVLILGFTFKENCRDIRNTKIIDVVAALRDYSTEVTVYDPWADPLQVRREYGLDCLAEMVPGSKYDAIIHGVAHGEFREMDLGAYLRENGVIYDVKGTLHESDSRL
ncbi:nucleotide sugar dehydrogenase [Chryseobacterium sp.]|uniref:nucleotide sugar dehydrogenase n=1 Tax=Chryseobacterium sp. TaxID=1871047 RepID=UPI0012A875C0|nr:nucleotide sugar dehydrogenase [Chryseobacterium sp.]QFG53755.1 nucleotide sugar dehydrogenase [Chryseobacterium sp.]